MMTNRLSPSRVAMNRLYTRGCETGVGVAVGVEVCVGVGVDMLVAEGMGLGVNVGGINSVEEGDTMMPPGTAVLSTPGLKEAAGVTVANEILLDGAIANTAKPMQ